MKLKLSFPLILITTLTACGGPKECDDGDVLKQIKETTLNFLQSRDAVGWGQMMNASVEAAQSGLAKAKEQSASVEVSDVFNFRKLENGTRTCKAKLTMQSLNGARSVVMKYDVINYEDGHQVDTDNAYKNLVGRVVADYVTHDQAELDAIRKEKMEARFAAAQEFMAKAPQGNVCADNFDQASFVRDHVDPNLGSWNYEYDEPLSEKVRTIVSQSKISVSGIETYGAAEASNKENLENSKYLYRCTGTLELTLPDGTVDANEQLSQLHFYAYAESQGSHSVSYRHEVEGSKFNLDGPARSIARKMKYGY